MSTADPARQDAFARLIATGISIRAAASAAGYGPKSNHCYTVARLAEVRQAVARYRLEQRHAGSPDLAPVIVQLMEAAEKAVDKGTAAHLAAAARLLAEAARLKPKLARHSSFTDVAEAAISDEDWVRRYGPPT